ncbi:MAG: amidohydrolase [Armatimonadetes bacterium]|nr:MAG: amidohydrolase [Armatimonadota bacterium]
MTDNRTGARPDGALLADLIALRHDLHRHPGVGFDVAWAASRVKAELEQDRLSVTDGIGRSGVVGSLTMGKGTRSIALRADLDALPITEAGNPEYRSQVPSAFHGCGHDGHTAMLVGAARLLSRRGSFDGTVHFVFQPAEEHGEGALAMIEDGLFDRFATDAVFGLHNLPGLPVGTFAFQPGPMAAFEETFEIVLTGKGGHASMPELTADPMVAGAEVVTALQTIVSRAVPPSEHAVVSITEFITDGARNIIPSVVTISGDVRGFTEAVSSTVRQRMGRIVAGIAQSYGVEATVRYQRAFEPVVNDPYETSRAADVAATIDGATVHRKWGRVGFSEDFGQMLDRRPGTMVLMGNGEGDIHAAQLHNPNYDFNDEALPYGVEYWVRLVENQLKPGGRP